MLVIKKPELLKSGFKLSFLKFLEQIHVFFYKKLGSAPSTKSFLNSHENFAIIVLKVS